MRHKVVALIYYVSNNRVRVLTGIESYYCFEESDDLNYNETLRKFETCSHEEASSKAIELSERYQLRIQYGDFINQRTHFCCLTSNSHVGLIKGDVFPNEPYIDAIQREIREETGLMIPESRFLYKNVSFPHPRTSLFFVPVTMEEVSLIQNYMHLRHNSHCGELFHVEFRDLYHYKMNHITRVVSEWLSKNPELPLLKSTDPIDFETLPDSSTCKEYDSLPIEEPIFKRGVKRPSLLLL